MDHLHLYTFQIDLRSRLDRPLSECLAPEERARAASYRTLELSRFAVVARGLLRHVLSRYAGIAPADIAFSHNDHGKPFLALPGGAPSPIGFNMSHSGAMVAIAVGEDAAIGVDIECPREIGEIDTLIERFFTMPERESLRDLSGYRRADGFFRLWTRKEAVLKASGFGLSVDPVQVDAVAERVVLGDGTAAGGDFPPTFFVTDISTPGIFHGALASGRPDALVHSIVDCEDPADFLGRPELR
jgi:4'-phosphopantetheinyl transferase